VTDQPPDLHDLVGDDLEPEELARLERVDALLRSVPAPPSEVPASLAGSIRTARRPASLWTRRRILAGLALAATIAAVFFAVGFWTSGGSSFEAVRTVHLVPTARAAGASGLIRLGARDQATGNWPFEMDVSGLPALPGGGYYVLWLVKDGRFAGACGTFDVGPNTTTVRMSASYSLDEYDKWVVTAWLNGRDNTKAPWLLEAPTTQA
jgi:Anti-sigma-K factor rskA